MIVKFRDIEIDIDNIKKVAPSVKVKLDDTITPISLDWFHDNENRVKFISFMLIIYFNNESKVDIDFNNEKEMFEVMIELDTLIKRDRS